MYVIIKKCTVGLATAGFLAFGSYAAQAQVLDDDDYVVRQQFIEYDEDDDDDDEDVEFLNRSGYARCVATFRSFDPSTGTYVSYAGETKRCPYLYE
jgi:hypothetical protein